MNFDIIPIGQITIEDSDELASLVEILRESEHQVTTSSVSVPGIKSDPITLAVAVTGVSFAGISAFISSLAYWHSVRPKYNITIESAGFTHSITSHDPNSLLRLAEEVKKTNAASAIVRISNA